MKRSTKTTAAQQHEINSKACTALLGRVMYGIDSLKMDDGKTADWADVGDSARLATGLAQLVRMVENCKENGVDVCDDYGTKLLSDLGVKG